MGVNVRFSVVLDGVDHIGIEAGVTVAVDVAGRFLQALVLLVLLALVGEVPDIDVVGGFAAELDGAVLAKQVEGLLQILRVDVGGALDGGYRAVLKLDNRHADILCLEVVVELLAGDAVDLVDLLAHHPAQQVDAVDALVHQRAAVLRPGASPFGLVVVVAVAVPADVDRAVGELAEAARLQRLAHLLHRYVKAVLVAGGDLDALLLAAADDLVCVGDAHRHRLFDDDIDAVVDAVQSNLGVDTALGGDADQLRLLLFDHFLIVGVAVDRAVVLQLMLCKQVFHLLGDDIADGCELQMVVEHRLDVVGCDSAAAD